MTMATNEIKCQACGEMIPADSRYCDMCGAEQLECVNCGTIGTDAFCPDCGKPMISRRAEKKPTPEPKAEEEQKRNKPKAIECEQQQEGGNQDKTTGAGRRKKIALRAQEGDITLLPEHEAVIGRVGSTYEEMLSGLNRISRRHGKFVRRGGEWYIVDFGSTNGTLVNDEELKPNVPKRIKAGDVVDIGTYLFDVIEL